jgi:Rapsyn N-terminal myristoylation and linker region
LVSFPLAHMDWGKFRDALDYGHHQLGISEELDNPQMRSEAYLNLARAHERLGEFRVNSAPLEHFPSYKLCSTPRLS